MNTQKDTSQSESLLNPTFSVESNDLISMEKLERNSPDSWPEKIPGVNEYIAMALPIESSPSSYDRGFSQDDINSIRQLAVLSTAGMISEIKKMYDEAYKLGIQESKEMTRGKYLKVFQGPGSTSSNKRKQL